MSLIEFNLPPGLEKRLPLIKRLATAAAIVAFGLWCRSCGYDAGKRYVQVDLSLASYSLKNAEQELRWAEKALRQVATDAHTYERCASREQPKP